MGPDLARLLGIQQMFSLGCSREKKGTHFVNAGLIVALHMRRLGYHATLSIRHYGIWGVMAFLKSHEL